MNVRCFWQCLSLWHFSHTHTKSGGWEKLKKFCSTWSPSSGFLTWTFLDISEWKEKEKEKMVRPGEHGDFRGVLILWNYISTSVNFNLNYQFINLILRIQSVSLLRHFYHENMLYLPAFTWARFITFCCKNKMYYLNLNSYIKIALIPRKNNILL